jgi:hypothetical protein
MIFKFKLRKSLNLNLSQIRVFFNEFLTMKADESADYAGRWKGRLLTGLCFIFFSEASKS